MEIDFSSDGAPVTSFENAVPFHEAGAVAIEICGVTLYVQVKPYTLRP
jgi:hypothetical protein